MSMNDPRVPAWGNLKFIEKLREFASEPTRMPNFGDKNIVCHLQKDNTGHFGAVDDSKNLLNLANQFAWLDFLMLNPSVDTALPVKRER